MESAVRDSVRSSLGKLWRGLTLVGLFIRFSAASFSIILPLLGAAVVAPTSSQLTIYQILVLSAVAVVFHAFAYVLNDVIDLPIDRTEPLRAQYPLVLGLIQPWQALLIALLQIPLALLLTLWLHANGMAYVALGTAFLCMTLYNLWGKRMPVPLLTDLIQGIGWGALVVYGAFAVHNSLNMLVGVIVAFVIVFVLMINGVHGSLRDLTNDLHCGARTTAIMFGVRPLDGTHIEMPLPFQIYAVVLQVVLGTILAVPLVYNWFGYQETTLLLVAGTTCASVMLSFVLLILCSLAAHNHRRMLYFGTLHIIMSLVSLIVVFAFAIGVRALTGIVLAYCIPLSSIAWDWFSRGKHRLLLGLSVLAGYTRAGIQVMYLGVSTIAASYTFLGVYLGGGITQVFSPTAIRAGLVVGFIVSASFVWNHYCDVEVDSLNEPQRPLASGRLPRRVALGIMVTLALSALLLAFTLGPFLLAMAIFNLAVSILYSYALKSTVLLGNVTIAYLDASIVLYGSLTLGRLTKPVLIVFALVFLYVLAQEILYTVRDCDGDARVHINTISTRFGTATALVFFRLVALGFVAVSLTLWLLGMAPNRFLYAVVPCSFLPLFAVFFLLGKGITDKKVHIALRLINIGWVLSLLPIILLK